MCISKTSHKTPHAVGCYGDKQSMIYKVKVTEKIPLPWCVIKKKIQRSSILTKLVTRWFFSLCWPLTESATALKKHWVRPCYMNETDKEPIWLNKPVVYCLYVWSEYSILLSQEVKDGHNKLALPTSHWHLCPCEATAVAKYRVSQLFNLTWTYADINCCSAL